MNSAGIGRSGTFIALDILMRSIEVDQKVNVLQTVLSMRKERPGMVQTEVTPTTIKVMIDQ